MKKAVKQSEMNVTRNREGWVIVSVIYDNLLINRKYMGYTVRECKRMLQEELTIKASCGW